MSIDTREEVPATAGGVNPELVQALLLLKRRVRWIAAGGAVAAVLGGAVATFMTPVYRVETIIAPKRSETSARVLSRLGGLGGFVATAVDAGNTPLDRLELLILSRQLGVSIVEKGSFLPRLYPDRWDEEKGAWKGSPPSALGAAGYLRSRVVTILVDRKKNTIVLGIEIHDPDLAMDLMKAYLEGINDHLRDEIRLDAALSREYLESQSITTTDPQLQAKIQQLIGNEIEKATLVSRQAFDILEPAWPTTSPIKPNRRMIILVSLLVGLALVPLGILADWKLRPILADLRRQLGERERNAGAEGVAALS